MIYKDMEKVERDKDQGFNISLKETDTKPM